MPKYGLILVALASLRGQSLGGGTIRGIVTDASGAAAPWAEVSLSNAVTGYSRQTRATDGGTFQFTNIPLNTYRLQLHLPGFQLYTTDVAIRSAVPVELRVKLQVAAEQTSIIVEGGSSTILENRPEASETVDRQLLASLPAFSPDSGLNDAILYTTPGVAADSNGFFHPLGDHAQVSYVIDGQPVNDQRNKVFSTSIPANAIQSMEVVSGSPAAEYGDKTSLVINATARSGLGQKPGGSFLGHYGSFGTVGEESTLAWGTARWGNFIAANGERSGRFLDTPEFQPLHDTGNTATIFDRIDFQPDGRNVFHLNLMAARNWLQVPNTYDQPRQDQRQKVISFNVAPGYQRTLGSRSLLSVNTFVRRDDVDYYPSRDPLNDWPATLAQQRSLMNWGARADLSHAGGRHNWKIGATVMQTRLDESFRLGITSSAHAPGGLARYDLTKGGRPYEFQGKANINQAALFVQDSITFGSLVVSAGLRHDRYRGLTSGGGFQPRGAFSYMIKRTGTVVRGGYSHTIETPTNENLAASSSTGQGGLAGGLFGGGAEQLPIALGRRNQYDAGIGQSIGKWALVDVSYFRKYTRNAFDFDALFSTPITFPIGWKQSKLDGVSARITSIQVRGWRVYVTMGHANARFFGPENGGIIFNSNLAVGAYRQDHDQVYQQNLNLHYQPAKDGWWGDFSWRYDSGLVVGAVNGLADALALTADQQTVIGLYCGAERASLGHRILSCASPDYGAERIHLLAPGAQNDDHNPPRATPRHIFSLGIGTDNLFRTEGVRTIVRLSVRNLANEAALYNFLSPFSGTHWVEPRSFRAQVGFSF